MNQILSSYKPFFFALAFILSWNLTVGQEVKSAAFDALLSGMLSESVSTIDVTELRADTSKVIFLDAREKAEYDVSHIQNAIWVGYDDFKFSRLENVSKEAEIVVYCSIGYRSEKIAEKLEKKGYINVKNLYGGIFEWVNEKQIVVDTQNNPTDRVHAFDKYWGVWLQNGEKIYNK